MNEKSFFKCEKCGNIVQLLWDGGGELVCCGQPMTKLVPDSVEASHEKHIPVCEKNGNTLKVQVGEQLHPMTPDHWIQWVAVEEPNFTQSYFLYPGDEPIVEFEVKGDDYKVYAYCNIHGLWVNDSQSN